jgi:hypothetical protein
LLELLGHGVFVATTPMSSKSTAPRYFSTQQGSHTLILECENLMPNSSDVVSCKVVNSITPMPDRFSHHPELDCKPELQCKFPRELQPDLGEKMDDARFPRENYMSMKHLEEFKGESFAPVCACGRK